MKIALCDDNQRELGKIEHSLNLHASQVYEFDFFSNGEKLLRHLNDIDTNYNIYFISIETPDIDGIALAQHIRTIDLEALIIFISDNTQRMPEVFKVQTFDYLLRPVSTECLLKTMNRATDYFNAIHAYFEFSFNRKLVVLAMNEIIYISKSGRIAYIHTTDNVYKTYMTMAEITDKLSKHLFSRIHGSYIVNLNYIVEIMKNEIFVKQFDGELRKETNTSLPMSRQFKDDLKEAYATFLNTRK